VSKVNQGDPAPTSVNITQQVMKYFGLVLLFFLLSFTTLYFINHYFSGGQFHISARLFTAPILVELSLLLLFYFLMDGFRLYTIIRAVGFRIPFRYIIKLVFVNIFISNVTPLATGGGVVQVYFLKQKGMPVGEAMAATSIRTLLAALLLFVLTPFIVWTDPQPFLKFFHKNILYGITGLSGVYLVILCILLFRIRLLKRGFYRGLHLLSTVKIISRPRFRSLFLKVSTELDLFSRSLRNYTRGTPLWVFLSLSSTVLFLLLLFSFPIVLLRALGYPVSPLTIISFQVVITFFMYFAPTPGAAGIAETGFGFLFAQLVTKQDLTFLTLSWRFLTIYIGVIVGMIIMYRDIFSQKTRAKSVP